MNLSIVSCNILQVDGKFLQVGQPMRMSNPRKLQSILTRGHGLIAEAIEEMYKKLSADPALTVKRGSVWVMRFTENEGSVINETGWRANLRKQEDRDVYRDRAHIKPAFLPYWDAAIAADFAPEIRLASYPQTMKGWCLLVRLNDSR